jgi:AraC family transcriptional regulator, regulatory protein of adaptative response / methylated-DNA-[protein]-cysteine methyltransferase
MTASKLPDRETMHRALVNKDTSFEGIFIVGVKTTGIFCRPGCTARAPKLENTEYFADAREALQYGYRPCKICRPLEQAGEPPSWLRDILVEVESNPSLRLKDYEIRQRGIDPARIRRWFKKNHDMTFQAYLRSRRLNEAFGRIRHTSKVTDSAFESGYDSLSGFNDAFKKATGFVPSQSGQRTVITITRILSPLGPLFAGATSEGICLLEFTDRRMLETQITNLRKRLNAEFIPGRNHHFDVLDLQLREYFEGKRRVFDLPLVVPGTEFQQQAWRALLEIPYAEVRSYGQQARAMGNAKAVRAVGKANGDNRIAIIIPCHRVVAADGSLTGYGGGLWRKKFLLELEKSAID